MCEIGYYLLAGSVGCSSGVETGLEVEMLGAGYLLYDLYKLTVAFCLDNQRYFDKAPIYACKKQNSTINYCLVANSSIANGCDVCLPGFYISTTTTTKICLKCEL